MNEMTASTHKNTTEFFMDSKAMNSMIAVAKLMSESQVFVPDHLKGRQSDCLAIVIKAAQWRMDPFGVAQKTHFVNGTIGYEAQLVNAVIASSSAIIGRFKYEYAGWSDEEKNGKIRCGAVLQGETEITWGEWFNTASLDSVKNPKFNNSKYPEPEFLRLKNSLLWKSNPKQQAAYLVVKYWARMYCPDVILGVCSQDELEDQPIQKQPIKDVTPKPKKLESKAASLLNKLKQKESEPAENTQDNNHSAVFDELMQQFQSSKSIPALTALCDRAKELPEHLKQNAQIIYESCMRELKAQSHCDPETGEILEENNNG